MARESDKKETKTQALINYWQSLVDNAAHQEDKPKSVVTKHKESKPKPKG